MALALEPDNIDRYGDQGAYDYDHDDHYTGSHLPFARIGTVLDTAPDGNSTLAGVDEITALKWQYQDKMVVMGLVFGSTFPYVFSTAQGPLPNCVRLTSYPI